MLNKKTLVNLTIGGASVLLIFCSTSSAMAAKKFIPGTILKSSATSHFGGLKNVLGAKAKLRADRDSRVDMVAKVTAVNGDSFTLQSNSRSAKIKSTSTTSSVFTATMNTNTKFNVQGKKNNSVSAASFVVGDTVMVHGSLNEATNTISVKQMRKMNNTVTARTIKKVNTQVKHK